MLCSSDTTPTRLDDLLGPGMAVLGVDVTEEDWALLGLTMAGISAARTPMRSPWLRYLPLTIGLYVFAVLTPGILAGFAPGQVVIGGWMLLFARLGRELVTTSSVSSRSSNRDLGTQR